MGKGLPSGSWLPGPSSASTASKVISGDAAMYPVWRGLSLGMAAVMVIALGFTRAGAGPFQVVAGGDPLRAMLPCQMYLVTMFAMMVINAALLDERRRHAVMESASFEVYGLLGLLSGDVVVVFEPSGWLLFCTSTVTDSLGVDDRALHGEGWLTLLHPDDRANALLMVNEVSRHGRSDDTFRMRHAGGAWRWYAMQLSCADGGAATDYLVVGLIRDVTDQVALEESLRSRAVELSAIAYTDPLTGLPNRRRLSEQRAAVWAEAARTQRTVSMLVVDIDRFKNYNDRYGHLAGDECLVKVAGAIGDTVRRSGDICARAGGEEFVVVLAASSTSATRLVAESIRTAVQALGVPHEASDYGVVTVSIGGATCVPDNLETGDLGSGALGSGDLIGDELFQVADDALYQAKASGRNAVVVRSVDEARRAAPVPTAIA